MKNNRRNKVIFIRYTLMEMVIVIAIMALLAAVVTPAYINHVKKAKVKTAKAQIEMLKVAVSDYYLDVGKWPKSLDDLVKNPGSKKWDGPYLANTTVVPKDPWGNNYVYVQPGNHGDFDIISYGADGTSGGEGVNKDIVSWVSE